MQINQTSTIHRMWVNQPSKQQVLYKLHGMNVIAVLSKYSTRIFLLNGTIVSMEVPRSALEFGWNNLTTLVDDSETTNSFTQFHKLNYGDKFSIVSDGTSRLHMKTKKGAFCVENGEELCLTEDQLVYPCWCQVQFRRLVVK
jgi:hypothetical protein